RNQYLKFPHFSRIDIDQRLRHFFLSNYKMERNNSLDPAFVQLAQSNIELREELNREVDINRANEKKIRQLIRDLEKCEGEIIRRSLTITDQENEIDDLKIQISNLRKQLRSVLKEIKSNETVIDSKNNQIAGYEEDILRLKKRIRCLKASCTAEELIPHKKISSNLIEMANLTPPRIPRSPRMDDTSRTFESVTQSIRNKIRRNPDTSLCNFVEYTLDELARFYNQSQLELAMERDNTRIAIDDAMSWQNATAYILDDVEKSHKGEKLMHTFWRVYYAKNTTRLLSQIFALKILCNRYKNTSQPQPYGRARLYGKYTKWKNRTRAKHTKYTKWKLRSKLIHDANLELEERINFLNQRIFDLQNNIPPQNQNMATLSDVMTSLAPNLAQIPQYTGQEPPDDYVNKIEQVFSYGISLNVNEFNDAVKTNILKSKMSGKYAPVPAQYPLGTDINTPALFRNWIRHRYHELTLGSRQASLSKLAQEKFLLTDTPETYEERIRLLLLQTPNNNADALAILWNHLPEELFTRVKIANPGDINAFFTAIKNTWQERKPATFTYNGGLSGTPLILPSSLSHMQEQPLESAQQVSRNKKAYEHLEIIAMRLGYPDNAPRDPNAFDKFIEDELENRLGYENYHIKKINTVRKVSGTKRSVPAIQQQKLVRSGTTAVRHKNARQTRRRAPSRVSGKLTKKVNFAVRSEDKEEYYSDSSSPTSEESEEEDSRRERVYNSSDQEEIDSEEDENNLRQSFGLKKKKAINSGSRGKS